MKEIFLVEASGTGGNYWSPMGAFETQVEAQKAVTSQRNKSNRMGTGWKYRYKSISLYETYEEASRELHRI